MTKLREVPKDDKINIYCKYLGYQIVNESLQWLRIKLRYGKKPSYDDTEKVSETDNPQPSS